MTNIDAFPVREQQKDDDHWSRIRRGEDVGRDFAPSNDLELNANSRFHPF
jgi:hypothetical protein